jgi:hypothetical protein
MILNRYSYQGNYRYNNTVVKNVKSRKRLIAQLISVFRTHLKSVVVLFTTIAFVAIHYYYLWPFENQVMRHSEFSARFNTPFMEYEDVETPVESTVDIKNPSVANQLSLYESLWSNFSPKSNIFTLPNGRLKRIRRYKKDPSISRLTLSNYKSFDKLIAPLMMGDQHLNEECQNGVIKRWAVITTIVDKPTEAMIELLNISLTSTNIDHHWCLVVVLDLQNSLTFNANSLTTEMRSRMVYLTVEIQKNLPYKTIQLTPMNSFSRKNIGYLFAMHNGAEVILDLDDDNIIIDIQEDHLTGDVDKGPIYLPVLSWSAFQRPPLADVDLELQP